MHPVHHLDISNLGSEGRDIPLFALRLWSKKFHEIPICKKKTLLKLYRDRCCPLHWAMIHHWNNTTAAFFLIQRLWHVKCRNMTYSDSLTWKKVIWEIHRVVSGCMAYLLLLLPPIWSIWVYLKMLWYTQKLQGLTREMMIKQLNTSNLGIAGYMIPYFQTI